MIKHLRTALATAVAASTLAVVVPITLAPAASADRGSPGCVTRNEFRRVDTNGGDAWNRDKVTRVFGTRGRVDSYGSGGTSVDYRTCAGDPDWSYAEVDFDNGRAWWKWIYISR